MIKFFRKIRQKLITENKFSKYLLYAIGEIVLVVIGILIALQINNWNNKELEKEKEQKSYQNIRRQILDDKNELTSVKDYNNYHSAIYEYANKIITQQDYSKADSLALFAMGLSQFSDFHSRGNIYETLVNSGEIKLLKNSNITSRLQQLEMKYIFANKLENMHWEIIINNLAPELRGIVNYATFKPVKPKKLYAVEMQNIFTESIYLTKIKDEVYNQALSEIDTIIALIDGQLNLK